MAPFTDTYGIEVETPSCVFVGCGSGPSVMERHAMNGPPSSIHRLIPGSSLRDTVESSLSAAIVSGELAPGTLVSVPTLAAQFGVSATPVREAMLDLEKRGFVQPVRNKGCLVTNVSEQDLPDIVQVRRWLEGPAMRIAAEKLEGRSVEKYRRARATSDAAARSDFYEYLTIDAHFHLALLQLTGNGRLVALVAELRRQTRLVGLATLSHTVELEVSANEHHEWLDLLAGGGERRPKSSYTRTSAT